MPEPEGKLITINQLQVTQTLLVESLSDPWVRGCPPVLVVKEEPKLTSARRTCCNVETEVKSKETNHKSNKTSSNADFTIRVKINSNSYFTNADYSIISGLRKTLLNV